MLVFRMFWKRRGGSDVYVSTLLLYELKSELDRLQNALDSGKESDLLGMVNYALKKYLGILHCLEDGMVDLSNNACERQNLRITKYLLNNYKTSALGLLRA